MKNSTHNNHSLFFTSVHNSDFFLRISVPQVDPKTYRLEIYLNNEKSMLKSLSLDDIKLYPKCHEVSSIPCQNDPEKKKNTIGHTWSGTKLQDIFQHLGQFNYY